MSGTAHIMCGCGMWEASLRVQIWSISHVRFFGATFGPFLRARGPVFVVIWDIAAFGGSFGPVLDLFSRARFFWPSLGPFFHAREASGPALDHSSACGTLLALFRAEIKGFYENVPTMQHRFVLYYKANHLWRYLYGNRA